METFDSPFQLIILIIHHLLVEKSEQEFVRQKKLTFSTNIGTNATDDSIILQIFLVEVI